MDGRNDAGQMDRWTEGFMVEFMVQWTGGRTLDGQVDEGWGRMVLSAIRGKMREGRQEQKAGYV